MTALRCGAVDPSLWRGGAEDFVRDMVLEWITAAGNGISEYGFHLFVSDRPHVSVETFVAPHDRLYLVVYANSHWGIALRDPVRAMEAVDRRMPSWVWSRLRGALVKYVNVWDPSRAIAIEKTKDWPFDPQQWGDEEGEDPGAWRPSRITPKSLQRKSVSDRAVRGALKRLGLAPDTWAARVIAAALDIAAWGRMPGDSGYTALRESEKAAFEMVVDVTPSVVAWIEPDGDPIMHGWDYFGENFQEMDEDHFGPSSCWPFNPSDAASLLALRERVEHFCGLMQRAGKLFDLLEMPPRELLSQPRRKKKRKTLIEVLLEADLAGGEEDADHLERLL